MSTMILALLTGLVNGAYLASLAVGSRIANQLAKRADLAVILDRQRRIGQYQVAPPKWVTG